MKSLPLNSFKMEEKKKKKGILKLLTGMVVGGAVGSILGLTLAPRKGEETRKAIKDKSMDLFLKGKREMKDASHGNFIKRAVIKALKPKKKKDEISQ